MDTKSHIIKVVFPSAVDGSREHYFGSLAAIYETFTPYQIGCKVATLWKAGIEPGKEKKTSKCVVSRHEVLRKAQKKERL